MVTRAFDEMPFLATERILDGVPIDKAAAALTPEAVEAAVTRAPAALHALHVLHIAHNDLRGPNVLVTPRGELWLIDLGHATLGADRKAMERDVAELGELLAEVRRDLQQRWGRQRAAAA